VQLNTSQNNMDKTSLTDEEMAHFSNILGCVKTSINMNELNDNSDVLCKPYSVEQSFCNDLAKTNFESEIIDSIKSTEEISNIRHELSDITFNTNLNGIKRSHSQDEFFKKQKMNMKNITF